MHPVVHFQLPYENKSRMMKFYQDVFKWHLQDLGNDDASYVFVTTGLEDAPQGGKAGVIDGGLFPKLARWPQQYPTIVINVVDIWHTIKVITAHAGEVLGEPMTIPNFGDYVAFVDCEGNRLGLIQPRKAN